jgi:predicted nucleotidyltransferase
MHSDFHPALAHLVSRAASDPDVLAVILFGSHARGEVLPTSDVDICLVLVPGFDPDRAFERKLTYSGAFDVDLALLHELPLHVRSRVLREGRVLFVRDEDTLYDLAIRTARAFDDFQHIHRQYLDEIARG